MVINYKNNLLYTVLKINYLGKEKLIEDVIIDTGAAHSLISSDLVEDI